MSDGILRAIRTRWRSIADPFRRGDIVASGRVQSLLLQEGAARFVLEIAPTEAARMEPIRAACESEARKVKGVKDARGVLTAHAPTSAPSSPPGIKTGAGAAPSAGMRRAPNRQVPQVFDRIHSVIAVASGKGGVGKSTVAVNLAAVLAEGARAGLLDADIYGPSAPQLLGVTDKPAIDKDKKVIPVRRFDMATMSIGYMVPPDRAMIWRGPVVQSALMQMLEDVAWPPLDVLVLDMPPGTGDVQLTMAQRIPVAGALIVTTPQILALTDVRRAAAMFRRVEIPVLGVVENMSWIAAPDGSRLTPFGAGGGKKLAQELDLPFLGELPLDERIQAACDAGAPLCHFDPKAMSLPLYRQLAAKLKARLRELRGGAQRGGIKSQN